MATKKKPRRIRVVSPLQRPDGTIPAGSRVVIDVRWNKRHEGWMVTWRIGARLAHLACDGKVWMGGAYRTPCPLWAPELGFFERATAISAATTKARALWAGGDGWDRIPAQVRIYRKDGTLQSERTYPDVTPRRAG